MGGVGRWCTAVVACCLVLGACSGDDDDTATETSRASTTVASTTPLVTSPNGEPVPEGDYSQIAARTDDGLEWTLEQAPAAGGGKCWRLATEPALDLVFPAEHCVSPVDPGGAAWFNVDFPYSAKLTADHDIVVVSSPVPVTEATFAFADGTKAEPVSTSDDGTVVVWAGASDPAVLSVALTLDDETKAACGPGDVQSATQMKGKSAPEIRDIREFPWTCIEVDSEVD